MWGKSGELVVFAGKSGVHPFKKWTPPLTVDVLAH